MYNKSKHTTVNISVTRDMNNKSIPPSMYMFDEKIVRKMKREKIILSTTASGGLMISKRNGKFETDDRSVSKLVTGIKSVRRPNKTSPNDYTLQAFGDLTAAKLRQKERNKAKKLHDSQPSVPDTPKRKYTKRPKRKYTKRPKVVTTPVVNVPTTPNLTLTFKSGATVHGSPTDIKELLSLLEL